jgi:hypothetical protein
MNEHVEQEGGAQRRGAGGGAIVGAVFGGLVGAVLGWLLGAPVESTPEIGPTVGSGVLTTTLLGLLVGAALGALLGGLMGSALRPVRGDTVGRSPSQQDVEGVPPAGTVSPYANDPGQFAGLEDAAPEAFDETDDVEVRKPSDGGPIPASPGVVATSEGGAPPKEANTMADEQVGRDPNSHTGTTDAIDPGTGALGTGGTPVTTGYGASGSTIGTGSSSGEADQMSGEFRGENPGLASYESGGRGGANPERLEDAEKRPAAVDRYADSDLEEANIPVDPSTRDVYESSPGYAENLNRSPDSDATQGYSDASVDSPPSYGRIDLEAPNESAGTNIPGTSDPTGLGDNTEDRT